MAKTYEEINAKIKKREAVVVTAEEMISLVEENGAVRTARNVDVVTTGTFGAMCSSGAFLNLGHSAPRINASSVTLNNVEAYAGIAAVDCYLGATKQQSNGSGSNSQYGGGHVIHDLVSGKKVELQITGYGTDCYPRKRVDKAVTLEELPDAFLFCPRNGYQNYNCAVNCSNEPLATYMGVLKPQCGNATYSGAGELSPLMNDPLFRTIGIGTRIFLGGGVGYVTGPGTQHNPHPVRTENGIPRTPAGTLAVTGNMKEMSGEWLKGVRLRRYGTSLMVGLGIPIPVLDESIAQYTAVRNRDIRVPVVDYSSDYPGSTGRSLSEVTVADINSGEIMLSGRQIPAYTLSNQKKARRIAEILKEWILSGSFEISRPVASIPAQGNDNLNDGG